MENEIMYIKLDDIIPNRFQPREVFDEESLNKLADSIRQHGVIEPILVRPVSNKYEIVAGERRYKASALAGLTKIPAMVRQLDDKESSIVAFIENEHRSDVSAIEEARTMDRILKNNDMTQEELAKELGVNQSTIANKLRLLNLPLVVQESLMHNEISERHARSLLSVKDEDKQIELLNKIKEKKMTVRELDSEIKNMNENNNQNEFIYENGNPGVEFQTGNNSDFLNYLNNYDAAHPTNEIPKTTPNNDFMSYLNNYDTNHPVDEEKPPIEPVSSDNSNFLNFLDNYDNDHPVNETPATAPNNDFMSYLNNYDMEHPLAEEKPPVEPVSSDNSSFLNFLDNYDNDHPVNETPENIPNNDFMDYLNNYDTEHPVPEESEVIDNNVENNNVLINNVNPPITSDFANQYVEDTANYYDVSKQEKINDVDTIINKLGAVVNEIKEKSIFKVDTEEINYDDIYQITIKIDKRDF